MSYLSACLSQLMTQNGIKGADITRASKIDSATISRWLNGTQVSIRDEDLEKVSAVVAKTREDQARLVVARMRDVCKGPGSELIDVTIGKKSALKEASGVSADQPLALNFEHAFLILRKNMNDPDVRDLVLSLAGLLDRPDPEENPEAKRDARKPARVRKLRGIEKVEEN